MASDGARALVARNAMHRQAIPVSSRHRSKRYRMTSERANGLIQALRGLYRAEGVRGVVQRVLSQVGARDTFVVLRLDLARPLLTPKSRVAFALRSLDDETLRTFRDAPYPFSRHYQYGFEYGQR